jgi:uncharacterized protein (DUF2267 family)
MPELGLPILDRTVNDTNVWLRDISEAMNHPDRQVAYHALRGVLFALRDRLVIDEALHLASQLPLLIRGIYFEGYSASGKPEDYDREGFVERVARELQQAGGADPEAAVRAVFDVLTRHIDEGEARHTREMLPKKLQTLWPQETA